MSLRSEPSGSVVTKAQPLPVDSRAKGGLCHMLLRFPTTELPLVKSRTRWDTVFLTVSKWKKETHCVRQFLTGRLVRERRGNRKVT